MTLLPDLCALALVLIAPFREGGREPLALLFLHLFAVAFAVTACRRAGFPALCDLPRAPIALAIGALGLASISALRADYALAAWLGFVDLVVAALVLVGAIVSGGHPLRAERVRTAVVIAALLQAVLVFARYRSGGVMAAGASFLNPNHLAAFLNIGIALAVTAAENAVRGRHGTPGSGPPGSRRVAIVWGAAAVTLLAASLLIGSRGAALGLLAMIALFLVLRLGSWPRAVRVVALGLLAMVVVAGAARIAQRFSTTEDPFRYHRLAIWRAAIGMILDRPVLGHGPGMFPHLAPARNFPFEEGPLRFERGFDGAHAAPLTLAAEIGLPAALLAFAAVACVVTALVRRRDGMPPGPVELGAGLALVALVLHGCVEDLQRRPALVLIPALVAGTALGSRLRRPNAVTAVPGAGRWPVSARALAGVAIVYGVGLGIVQPWIAHHEAEAARRAGPAGIERMRRAAWLNRLHPEYRHDLAMAVLNSGPPSPERYAEAYRLIAEARRLKPIDPRFPLLLGRLEALAGDRLFVDPGAAGRATALYLEAIELSPCDPRPRLELARHLADHGDPAGALDQARAALVVEPHFVRARIVEASTLLSLHRNSEAAGARDLLDATLVVLRGFVPQSGYADEIVRDAPETRARIDAELPREPSRSKG